MGLLRAAVVVALVVLAVAPAATGRPAARPGARSVVAAETDEGAAAGAPRTDNTVTRIAVRTDGDARWTVRVRTRLRTAADVEDYRAFQRAFRNDTSQFLAPFARRIRATVADARNATGREMRARNFSASTSIQEVPRRWGVVSFSFTWTNFARVEGEALVVGDVFEGGLLLTENDSLVVTAPPGYVVASTDPRPDVRENDTVTWKGQQSFADERPRVRLEPAPSPTPTTGTGGGPGGLSRTLVVAAAVALLGAVLAVLRRGWRPTGGAAAEESDGGDPSVLTDGERVERLLADAGGRMRQAEVADELGWSDSKTSRVVSDLVEAGRVEKLRVGRENVLDLADGQD